MKFIKHKNMRDVCAQVINHGTTKTGLKWFRVCWINLRGTFDYPFPFAMGSSRPAIEVINIHPDNLQDWETRDSANLFLSV